MFSLQNTHYQMFRGDSMGRLDYWYILKKCLKRWADEYCDILSRGIMIGASGD